MTIEEINKKIKELELEKNELLKKEKERRAKEVNDAFDRYDFLNRKYIEDYGSGIECKNHSKDINTKYDEFSFEDFFNKLLTNQ